MPPGLRITAGSTTVRWRIALGAVTSASCQPKAEGLLAKGRFLAGPWSRQRDVQRV
jgi:hypothetical protein